MQLKRVKIGSLTTKNNVFLAPLAGYTNYAFRSICLELGAGLTFTEMVSCKGLKYSSQGTSDLLYTADNEEIKAVQIFGNDVEVMEWAAKSEYLAPFNLIDINMGCPMPKIYNNGEGSALLNNLNLASKIITAVKKSGKAVSVKFRIGIEEGHFVTTEFAKMCEDSGADMITVHGRVKDKIYQGDVNFKEIALAKNAVKIPVIANGGVFSKEDADKLMSETGADGIMIARGALYEPWLFSEITGNENYSKKDIIIKNVRLLQDKFDDKSISLFMRKQMMCYLHGVKGSKRYKEEILKSTCVEDFISVINRAF